MFRWQYILRRTGMSLVVSNSQLPLIYRSKRPNSTVSGKSLPHHSISDVDFSSDINKASLDSGDSIVAERTASKQDESKDLEFLDQFLIDFSDSSNEVSNPDSGAEAIQSAGSETVNIDQSDEIVFDHEFLGMDGHSTLNANEHAEKDMFANIFEEYLNPMSSNISRQKDVLSRINDSFYKTQRKHTNLLSSRESRALSKMSSTLRDELFKRTKLSIQPTLEYIDNIETSTDLVKYFNFIIDAWKNQAREASQKASQDQLESIYLNNLLSGPQTVGPSHEKWLESLQTRAEKEPLMPGLNVLTLPTIFNRIVKNLAFEFRDGQLCLSLFNIAKQDLAAYTIMCNQQTYNEVMKALWIYNGKSNLYNVETVFVEMKNNGFTGDITTCNILKQIIIDYHQMKSGQFSFNVDTGTRIWSKDDDIRVATLEKGLHDLVGRLRRLRLAQSPLSPDCT